MPVLRDKMPPVVTSTPARVMSSMSFIICAMCSALGGPLGGTAGV
jgi:hypothetical protein